MGYRDYEPDDDYDPYGRYEDRIEFESEGSALRRSSKSNPRNLPCPTCGKPNRLTPADKALGYQCDECADRAEGTYMGADY